MEDSPNKKEKKEHEANIIQNPWKGVAVVAAQKLSRESSDYNIIGGGGGGGKWG